METYRIYYNRIEEFYIDIQANSIKEARNKWYKNDLQSEEETGNYNIKVIGIEVVNRKDNNEKIKVMKNKVKQVKQYLLYIQNQEDNVKNGNWSIEYYDKYHDLQDRIEALEYENIPYKTVVEYTNGEKAELNFNLERI